MGNKWQAEIRYKKAGDGFPHLAVTAILIAVGYATRGLTREQYI